MVFKSNVYACTLTGTAVDQRSAREEKPFCNTSVNGSVNGRTSEVHRLFTSFQSYTKAAVDDGSIAYKQVAAWSIRSLFKNSCSVCFFSIMWSYK